MGGHVGRRFAQAREDEGEENRLFQLIRAEGYRREPYLLLATLRAVADGRLGVRPGEALDDMGNPLALTLPNGLELTEEIEAAIAAADSAG